MKFIKVPKKKQSVKIPQGLIIFLENLKKTLGFSLIPSATRLKSQICRNHLLRYSKDLIKATKESPAFPQSDTG
jgi:hypothetical protein